MAATRDRRFFQGDNLYVGPTPSSGYFFTDGSNKTNDIGDSNLIEQLYRIQSYSYDMNNPMEMVQQLGELSEIDQVSVTTPTVNLNFNYLLANLENERRLGFVVDGSATCIKNILDKSQDDKCYFIKSAPEGIDGVGDVTSDSTVSILGIGNGYLTSYSTEASVGGLPTVSLTVEGLNAVFSNLGTSGYSPAINTDTGLRQSDVIFNLPTATTHATGAGDTRTISVLRAGDITVTFSQADSPLNSIYSTSKSAYSTMGADLPSAGEVAAKIQSYSLSFDLSRSPIEGLGSRYAYNREVNYPSNISLSVDALVGDLNTGSWNDLVECTKVYDVTISMKDPVCNPASRTEVVRYTLKNARMTTQSYSQGIGDNQTVTLQFQATHGGPSQTNKGLFMSGVVEA